MSRQTQQYYDMLYKAQGKDYGAESEELARLIKAHHARAKTILDVGCGTGTHARILRDQFNLEVDGVDIDQDMIAIARAKIPEGTFDVGDMSDFDTGQRYDVIVSMFSAIGYVQTLENVTKALKCFREHIKDDGIVIVEPWLTPEVFKNRSINMDTASEGDTRVARMSRVEVEGRLSHILFHWTVANPDEIITIDEKLTLGLFSVDEMKACFEEAGFEVTHDRAEGQFSNRGLYIAKPAPF
jgi:SAM-dependent methyltransferase